jgi:hypothetical protein
MQNETINNLGEVKPVVLIGGKTGKFVPNLNMSFFDDEFFINLNRKDKIITDEVAEIKDYKTVLNGIDNDIFHVNENGDFKWDILIPEKPKYNFFKWEIKSKGVEFYYQAELTAEEILDGCIRPENVVGSYAVYCSKQHNKYKTGKVAHIYRPLCIDANGLKAYADLNIDSKAKTLTITIPQDYLDNAAYPMTLDPTIGYTSIGAGIWSRASAIAVESLMVSAPTSNGTASKVYIYLSSGYNTSIQLGYYSDSSLASSDSISSPTEGAWNSVNVSGSISSGELYYPAFSLQSSGTGSGGIAYDDQTDGMQYENNISSLPATWTSASKYTRKFSLYLEYTESGGTGNAYYYQQMQM